MDAIHQRADAAQIGIPAPLGHIVGVADSIAEMGSLAADFTVHRHRYTSLIFGSSGLFYQRREVLPTV